MSSSFELSEYSIDTLKNLLVEHTASSLPIINRKLHSQYLEGYFNFLSTKTIVAELRYVDHDYLEDFAGYYVKCFKKIPRKCTRLHFFQNKFTEKQFKDTITQSDPGIPHVTLQENYLGFIVLRPLPETIVGRTCLKVYPQENDTHYRFFPNTRTYAANLFGIELTVDTLAFQEQDKVTAACATSALWSTFQGTGKLFQHAIPSPVEITKAATNNIPIESRVIPSQGLNAQQMAQAIRKLNLEPFSVSVSNLPLLQATIYAYLRGKIPLLLTIELFDTTVMPNQSMGHHAVAVAGCGIKKGQVTEFDESGFLLKAIAVDRLYAHDDQVGPFARMEIDGKTVKKQHGKDVFEIESLCTSWRGGNGRGEKGTGRAVPDFLLVPLHNKIRIPFGKILTSIYSFDYFLNTINLESPEPLFSGRLEWEIYLTTVNDFKSEFIQGESPPSPEERFEILTKRMARFLWVGKATLDGLAYLDLLFDATGIEQGNLFVRAIEHNTNFKGAIRVVANSGAPQIEDRLQRCDILKWFHGHP